MTQGLAPSLSGLARRNGRLVLERAGEDAVEVSIRYLRPLTGRTELVLLDPAGREVATVVGPEAFPPEERGLVEEALAQRYHLPIVTRVTRVDVRFGTRYWWVETDRGPRCFALREPGRNVSWVSARQVVLRDTAGNRYEIPDVSALDAASRKWVGIAL